MSTFKIKLELNIDANSEEEALILLETKKWNFNSCASSIDIKEIVIDEEMMPIKSFSFNGKSIYDMYPLIIKGKGYTHKEIVEIGRFYATKFDTEYSNYRIEGKDYIVFECIEDGNFFDMECSPELFLKLIEEQKTEEEKIVQNIVAFSCFKNMYTYKETEDFLREIVSERNEILEFFEMDKGRKNVYYSTYNSNMELKKYSIKTRDLIKIAKQKL